MPSTSDRPDFETIHRRFPYTHDLPHPRLFFSAGDLPALRTRAEAIPDFVENPCTQAEEHLNAPPLHSYDVLHTCMGQAIRRLTDLGSAYVLTGDRRYAEGVRSVLNQTFALREWIYPVHQPTEFDHGSANVSAAVAIALDLLGDAIADDERRGFNQRLIEKTVRTFRRVYANQSEFWVQSAFNWRSMICSDMGITLLTVLEEYPEFQETMGYALHGVLAILDGAPEDGEWGEGVGYWGAAIGLPLRLAIPLERMTAGALNLFEHPYLRRTGDFLLHATGPNGRVFNFADCGPRLSSRHAALLGLLGQKLRRPHWIKIALRYPPTDLFELICTAALEDPGALSDPPRAKHFRTYDIVTLRSGWGPEDTFIALKAGPTVAGHSHLDINGFMVTAFGETLISDLGTWPYAHYLGFFDRDGGRRWNFDANGTIGHNTLWVDGRGQFHGEKHYGGVRTFQPGERYDLVISDGARAYAPLLSRSDRWFLFIKPDVLIIFDEVEAEEPRNIQWLLHYEGEVASLVGEEPFDLRVVHGKAGFDLTFLLPSRDEGWVAQQTVRSATYVNSNTEQLETLENRFHAFSTLHSYPAPRFLAVFSFYPEAQRAAHLWTPVLESAEDEKVVFRLCRREEGHRVTLDVVRSTVSVEAGC